jgi:hypothetical protein
MRASGRMRALAPYFRWVAAASLGTVCDFPRPAALRRTSERECATRSLATSVARPPGARLLSPALNHAHTSSQGWMRYAHRVGTRRRPTGPALPVPRRGSVWLLGQQVWLPLIRRHRLSRPLPNLVPRTPCVTSGTRPIISHLLSVSHVQPHQSRARWTSSRIFPCCVSAAKVTTVVGTCPTRASVLSSKTSESPCQSPTVSV